MTTRRAEFVMVETHEGRRSFQPRCAVEQLGAEIARTLLRLADMHAALGRFPVIREEAERGGTLLYLVESIPYGGDA